MRKTWGDGHQPGGFPQLNGHTAVMLQNKNTLNNRPERFVNGPPRPETLPTAVWINRPPKPTRELASSAPCVSSSPKPCGNAVMCTSSATPSTTCRGRPTTAQSQGSAEAHIGETLNFYRLPRQHHKHLKIHEHARAAQRGDQAPHTWSGSFRTRTAAYGWNVRSVLRPTRAGWKITAI